MKITTKLLKRIIKEEINKIQESGDVLQITAKPDGGWMLTEHGSEQGQKVRKLYESVGFRDVGTFADLSGLDRVTLGCVP